MTCEKEGFSLFPIFCSVSGPQFIVSWACYEPHHKGVEGLALEI